MDGSLSHYQDYKGREIDAVVKLSDGRWGVFEIKLGTKQIDAAAANLLKIKNAIVADNPQNAPSFLAIISGLSNAVYQRKDGVYVLPATSLKP